MKASNFGLYPDWLSSNIMFHVAYNLIVQIHNPKFTMNFPWCIPLCPKSQRKVFFLMKLQKRHIFLFQLILWCWSNITSKNSAWEERDGEMCQSLGVTLCTSFSPLQPLRYSNMNLAKIKYQKMCWYSLSFSSAFSQSLSKIRKAGFTLHWYASVKRSETTNWFPFYVFQCPKYLQSNTPQCQIIYKRKYLSDPSMDGIFCCSNCSAK